MARSEELLDAPSYQDFAVQKILWCDCYRNSCTEAPVSQNSTEYDDLKMYIIRDDLVQMGFF